MELRDATKLLGSAVDAMVYHGVPGGKKHGQLAINMVFFLGEII